MRAYWLADVDALNAHRGSTVAFHFSSASIRASSPIICASSVLFTDITSALSSGPVCEQWKYLSAAIRPAVARLGGPALQRRRLVRADPEHQLRRAALVHQSLHADQWRHVRLAVLSRLVRPSLHWRRPHHSCQSHRACPSHRVLQSRLQQKAVSRACDERCTSRAASGSEAGVRHRIQLIAGNATLEAAHSSTAKKANTHRASPVHALQRHSHEHNGNSSRAPH